MLDKINDGLSVAIVMPNNLRSGPHRMFSTAAIDLARAGHSVTLFIPVLPWYFYFVSLRRHPMRWLRYALPHAGRLLRDRKPSIHEILDHAELDGRVSTQFIIRRATKNQLKPFDCLIFNSIAGVSEYQSVFPQERQVYLLNHPEEHVHGHEEIIQNLRKEFKGKILVISPFTARQISDHVPNAAVVPNPVSPMLWEQRRRFQANAIRKDILLVWKDNSSARLGVEVIEALRRVRPDTTLTIWSWGVGARTGAQEAMPNVDLVDSLGDAELRDLYLGHSFLLFPSNYEGFGMPPIEALACGCIPILQPEVGAAELYASNGVNSVFLNSDPESIAARIANILSSPDTLQSMRLAGPESIEAFNPDGYGVRLLEAAGIL